MQFKNTNIQKGALLLALSIISFNLIGCGAHYASQPELTYQLPRVAAMTTAEETGEILVRFKRNIQAIAIRDFHNDYNTLTIKILPEIGVYVLKLPAGTNMSVALKRISEDSRVEFAEPNRKVKVSPVMNRPQGDVTIQPVKR